MVSTSARELVSQRLKAQLDSLPEEDPKRKIIASILNEKPENADAQRDALRRIALERYYALQDGDPLKEVLGKVLGGGTIPPPTPEPPANLAMHAFRGDAWDAVQSLERGQQSLGHAVKTIDARSAAAMAEAKRLAAKAVEMQELLNMVLEEVHQNTQMLKSFKEVLVNKE